VSLQPEWHRRVAEWRDLLARCARTPSRKRVHLLRSLTLRLQVELEYKLPGQATETKAAGALRRWQREAKKLRRALRPVRDADVYLAGLDGLRDTLRASPEGEQKFSPRCLREMDKLESRLKRRRLAGIDKLMAALNARGKRLRRLSKELEAALSPPAPPRVDSMAEAALGIFAGVASELPNLNSVNLHVYRKRLKPALYLAEIAAADDPLARRLAAAFRKIHNATGDWHDWQTLALEASHILPDKGKQDGLVPVLETLAERARQRSLGLYQRSATAFLENASEARPSQRRKPVAADPGFQPGHECRSFGIPS